MSGKRYVVVEGDNLWNIAKAQLGAGSQWPRIWRYNNRREVVAITGRGILNPDLIYVGQTLLIPELPGVPRIAPVDHAPPPPGLVSAEPPIARPTPRPEVSPSSAAGAQRPPSGQMVHRVDGNHGLAEQLRHIESPVSFKYRLDDMKFPPVDTPTALIEFRMTGDVILMSRKAVSALYVTSRQELEVQMTQAMNHAYGELVRDHRFIYDPVQKRITVRSMLVSRSNLPNSPSTAVGVEMSSNSPIPKLRAEIRFPKLEGSIEQCLYSAFDVKFVIEITPKAQPPQAPSAQRLAPSAQEVRQPSGGTDWSTVIGAGLVITAGAIVVGTIVEDFLSAGAGTLDDPASFAAAAAAFARGMSLIRGAAVVLPRTAVPAMVTIGVMVEHDDKGKH